ncbi:MAG TPA: hypothetical protein VGX21_22600, partial [Methylomirabilota bacterium]|nr:hypothetical protein [Methylomirabilota bacterium]
MPAPGKSKSSFRPADVVKELHRRRLADLGDCRIAWEQGADPLALCVAITKTEMPEWLADALLLLHDGAGLPLLQRLWVRQRR